MKRWFRDKGLQRYNPQMQGWRKNVEEMFMYVYLFAVKTGTSMQWDQI